MKPGPKPKPTARKALEGWPGHHPRNPAEPQLPAPADVFAVPPAELDGHVAAGAEWRRLAPLLLRARVVTDADRGALVALCLEWDRYLQATEEIRVKGMVIAAPSGYPMVNPYCSIASRALAACNRLWPELGLTPSSRSRVEVTPGGSFGADDPFAEFDLPRNPS
jgi:P27 family predicted phage terminase small subunit